MFQSKINFFSKRKNQNEAVDDGDGNSNTCASKSIRVCTSSSPQHVDMDDLPYDPSERKKITDYHPNQRDEVRRRYLIRGPCQPHAHDFPKKQIGKNMRRFNPDWFIQYGNWIEYSIKMDKAYCLCCYLFRGAGNDTFITEGFNSWNKTERLAMRVGDVNSFHNNALKKCDDLMRQDQSIAVALRRQDDIVKVEHRVRLNASIDASRFLLQQGLAFRGHDESEKSMNQGNFIELIKYTAAQNESINKVVLKNAPGNNQMRSPDIQKDIIHCFSQEVLCSILKEIGDGVFALLVDESSDVSYKEQMAVILRFVDAFGLIKERFIGVVHVKDTTAASLKSAIDTLFSELGLSLQSIRGQGYDGASNMRGEFNGLRALISQENNSAYYVHCFAHQLQLVVVAISKKHFEVGDFFEQISLLVNVVVASCKRKDTMLELNRERVKESICNQEIKTGSGLNQEITLVRPGSTRWGSHYHTLLRLTELYPVILKVLEYIEEEGLDGGKRRQAYGLLKYFQSFNFAFYLQLMLLILGLTESLSEVLQRKDQDILNAMSMVTSTKKQLQSIRDAEWNSLLMKVLSFCKEHDLPGLNMDDEFVDPRRPRRKSNITNLQHLQVDCFYTVVDCVMQEFSDRFNELMRLATLYPNDFEFGDRMALEQQLHIYIDNIREDVRFSNLKDLGVLGRLMVETGKHLAFPLIYRLLKLVLTLPVATATVERCFSAMKIMKTDLRNRMGDSYLNGSLICYIENDIFRTICNDDVIDRFMKMKTRKEQL